MIGDGSAEERVVVGWREPISVVTCEYKKEMEQI